MFQPNIKHFNIFKNQHSKFCYETFNDHKIMQELLLARRRYISQSETDELHSNLQKGQVTTKEAKFV